MKQIYAVLILCAACEIANGVGVFDFKNRTASVNYGRPFETRYAPTLIPLPPGAIEPQGWLRDWSIVSRDGFTGHMNDVSEDFRNAWTADYKMTGEKLTYWHKGAWPYEGGAYWFDGLNKIAYSLHDKDLIELVQKRLEPVISNRNTNGILFMWWLDKKNPKDVEACEKDGGVEAYGWPIWANGLIGRTLTGYYASSQNPDVLKTLENAYANSEMWCSGKLLPNNLWPAYETFTWGGNKAIEEALNRFFEKNPILKPDSKESIFTSTRNRLPDVAVPPYVQPDHGVCFNEGFISWAVGYLWTGRKEYLDLPLQWYAALEQGDVGMQPYGVNVGDENTGPTGSFQGTETCDVGGYLWSQITLLRITGQGSLGDRIERAFFNAGPAAVTRDYNAHVYAQTPNRIRRNLPDGEVFVYGRDHWPQCCAAALNRILPSYVTSMWMATYDNGLAATCHGPCKVNALAGNRVPVELECLTDYPFNDTIEIKLSPEREASFPLSFRIPNWCRTFELSLNEKKIQAKIDANRFVRLSRRWKKGDRIRLRFPMEPVVKMGHDGDAADTPYGTVSYGPLLFSLPIPDTKDANTPDEQTKWKFALDAIDGLQVERSPMLPGWHWQLDSPLKIHVKAKPFDWDPKVRSLTPVGPKPSSTASPFSRGAILTILPPSAVESVNESLEITLIPYGCTKFRVSMFPVTRSVYDRLLPSLPLRPYATRAKN